MFKSKIIQKSRNCDPFNGGYLRLSDFLNRQCELKEQRSDY